MGCDIHMFVEEWDGTSPIKEIVGEPAWRIIGGSLCTYDDESGNETEFDWGPTYHDRNYTLFAILADVRNWSSSNIDPIDRPRGLPKDVSHEVKMAREYWDVNGHSASWLTLREILEYDGWEQKFAEVASSGPEGYRMWKETGDTLYLYLSRAKGREISNQEMDVVVSKMKKPDGNSVLMDVNSDIHTVATLTDTFSSVCDSFLKFVERLKDGAGGDLDRIRLVFWFDN